MDIQALHEQRLGVGAFLPTVRRPPSIDLALNVVPIEDRFREGETTSNWVLRPSSLFIRRAERKPIVNDLPQSSPDIYL